jgi:hypothetical protein
LVSQRSGRTALGRATQARFYQVTFRSADEHRRASRLRVDRSKPRHEASGTEGQARARGSPVPIMARTMCTAWTTGASQWNCVHGVRRGPGAMSRAHGAAGEARARADHKRVEPRCGPRASEGACWAVGAEDFQLGPRQRARPFPFSALGRARLAASAVSNPPQHPAPFRPDQLPWAAPNRCPHSGTKR